MFLIHEAVLRAINTHVLTQKGSLVLLVVPFECIIHPTVLIGRVRYRDRTFPISNVHLVAHLDKGLVPS